MRGLKYIKAVVHKAVVGRILYRCVDWNIEDGESEIVPEGRILYRCVDWNKLHLIHLQDVDVASYIDAWIEMIRDCQMVGQICCRILYRCVDWNGIEAPVRIIGYVASYIDAWIEITSVQ